MWFGFRVGETQMWKMRKQAWDRELGFEPRQGRADAQMSAATKSDVWSILAGDVEAVWIGKGIGIAIGTAQG